MTPADHTLDPKVVANIKKGTIPIVIFGAGIVGEALFRACCNAGVRIECFCDNNINKTCAPLCNTTVIHVPMLKAKYPEAIFLISAADIRDVVGQLQIAGYSQWYAANYLLRNLDVAGYKFSAPSDFVEYAIATCLLCHDSYLVPDKLFLRSVDIIITERCSLRCKDCSNLMQYYKKPADCSRAELLRSIDSFCNIIDEVNEFRVIGGEPFMNREFHLITKRLIDEPRVKRVVIYTNGTIAPGKDRIEQLKDKKSLVIITDYGKFSRKIKELVQILSDNNITYYIQEARGWTDCATIVKHNRTLEQSKDIFRRCCAKNTVTLSNGKLFRCPFSAHVDRLRAVSGDKNDYVPIAQDTPVAVDIKDVKNKISAFLLKKDYLQVCDYCNGRPFGAPEITPAIQAAKPLEYLQYDN